MRKCYGSKDYHSDELCASFIFLKIKLIIPPTWETGKRREERDMSQQKTAGVIKRGERVVGGGIIT